MRPPPGVGRTALPGACRLIVAIIETTAARWAAIRVPGQPLYPGLLPDKRADFFAKEFAQLLVPRFCPEEQWSPLTLKGF